MRREDQWHSGGEEEESQRVCAKGSKERMRLGFSYWAEVIEYWALDLFS